ncbi:Response regulator [Paramagnetospirillum magnetotacticum MS-1]|uniref:Response regulator n=1 Tax=Paramagnetospirillum magnetotacticum MS-1 TaxID=272627 RepID=A0A0C2UGT6_PARME|nr:Response regulator [Paramagnetospirillum magnetotacticum MS-1]
MYDALLSERPYKKPWDKELVIAYLQGNSGSHFDPHLVSVFLSILPEIDAISSRFDDDTQASTVTSVD